MWNTAGHNIMDMNDILSLHISDSLMKLSF